MSLNPRTFSSRLSPAKNVIQESTGCVVKKSQVFQTQQACKARGRTDGESHKRKNKKQDDMRRTEILDVTTEIWEGKAGNWG